MAKKTAAHWRPSDVRQPLISSQIAADLVEQAAAQLEHARQEVLLNAANSGTDLARAYSDHIDRTILFLWEAVANSVSRAWQPFERMAMVAQGGYGRQEMNLYSDVDLLIVIPEDMKEYEERAVQQIFQLLWDLHLDLGHATKTVRECLATVGSDIDSATALIEARFLGGNREVFDTMAGRFEEQLRTAKQRWFLEFRKHDWEERHGRYGSSVYLLEPNIKQGEGGLRDIHALRWLAYIAQGEPTLEALRKATLITRPEYDALQESMDFLLRVRNQLHILEKRKCDVLSFEKQIRVADALGYRADATMLAEEQFMRDYYALARETFRIGRHVVSDLAEPKRRLPWLRRDKMLFGALRLRGEEVFVQNQVETYFREEPARLVQIFAVAHDVEARVADSTRRTIEQLLEEGIGENLSTNDFARDAFLDILRSEEGVGEVLRNMHECGVLGAFMPEFQRLFCMVRADSYHKYTVDEHTLIAVDVADRLRQGNDTANEMLRREAGLIERWDLLYLAILLHDIGKGEGHGHVLRGGHIAQRVTARMSLPNPEAELVRRLVTDHLKLTHVAMRRDLDDPKVIEGVARDAGDSDYLRMLLILTFCDLRAVSPTSWTEWKGALLSELYVKANHVLSGQPAPVHWGISSNEEIVAKVREHLTQEEDEYRIPIADYIEELPDRYLATTSPSQIAHHYEMFDALDDDHRVVWELRHPTGANFSELTVVAYDRPGVFSVLCGALSSKRINILSAQVFSTKGGGVIDRFQVTDVRGDPLPEGFVLERLRNDANRIFCGRKSVSDLFAHLPPEKPMPKSGLEEIAPPSVTIDNESSDHSTIIEVKGYDRIGLLHDITNVFAKHNLTIDRAMITTEAYRVVDVFYVTDSDNNKIDDVSATEKLRKELLAVISK